MDSGSPGDVCVVGQLPVTESPYQSQSASSQGPGMCQRPRRLYSVAQLVQEPDSQVSTLGSTGTEELDADVDSQKVQVESHAAEGSLLKSTHKKRRVTLTPESPQELQRQVPCQSSKYVNLLF